MPGRQSQCHLLPPSRLCLPFLPLLDTDTGWQSSLFSSNPQVGNGDRSSRWQHQLHHQCATAPPPTDRNRLPVETANGRIAFASRKVGCFFEWVTQSNILAPRMMTHTFFIAEKRIRSWESFEATHTSPTGSTRPAWNEANGCTKKPFPSYSFESANHASLKNIHHYEMAVVHFFFRGFLFLGTQHVDSFLWAPFCNYQWNVFTTPSISCLNKHFFRTYAFRWEEDQDAGKRRFRSAFPESTVNSVERCMNVYPKQKFFYSGIFYSVAFS